MVLGCGLIQVDSWDDCLAVSSRIAPAPSVATPSQIPDLPSVTASLEQWIEAQKHTASIQGVTSVGNHVWAVFRTQGLLPVLGIVHTQNSSDPTEWQGQYFDQGIWGYLVPRASLVQFVNADEGWVAADRAIYRTTDSGEEWVKVWECEPTSFDRLVEFQILDSLRQVGKFRDGGKSTTSDSGENWQSTGRC